VLRVVGVSGAGDCTIRDRQLNPEFAMMVLPRLVPAAVRSTKRCNAGGGNF